MLLCGSLTLAWPGAAGRCGGSCAAVGTSVLASLFCAVAGVELTLLTVAGVELTLLTVASLLWSAGAVCGRELAGPVSGCEPCSLCCSRCSEVPGFGTVTIADFGEAPEVQIVQIDKKYACSHHRLLWAGGSSVDVDWDPGGKGTV